MPQGTTCRRNCDDVPESNATISKLSDSGQTVPTSAEDIRGRTVKDKDGQDLGKVHDLFIDDQERKVRFLLVKHGGFLGLGQTQSFIPVDAITKITAGDVLISHTREHVAAAPRMTRSSPTTGAIAAASTAIMATSRTGATATPIRPIPAP